MFTNALLVVIMTHPQIMAAMGGSSPNYNPYLAFIFYSVLGLSVVRFLGAMLYLFFHIRDHYASCRGC